MARKMPIRLSVKERAKIVVSNLLEGADHVCVQCGKEHGIHDDNASHGICRRHMIETYGPQMKEQGEEFYQRWLKKQMDKPDEHFAPDLGEVTAPA